MRKISIILLSFHGTNQALKLAENKRKKRNSKNHSKSHNEVEGCGTQKPTEKCWKKLNLNKNDPQ